jgi:ABC-type multidrug transport system ATPase subunit
VLLLLESPGAELDAAVESSLRAVNLWNNSVADKQARQYSGGMKRRLSVAISFFGDPVVVYMDEPSTVRGSCVLRGFAKA